MIVNGSIDIANNAQIDGSIISNNINKTSRFSTQRDSESDMLSPNSFLSKTAEHFAFIRDQP